MNQATPVHTPARATRRPPKALKPLPTYGVSDNVLSFHYGLNYRERAAIG